MTTSMNSITKIRPKATVPKMLKSSLYIASTPEITAFRIPSNDPATGRARLVSALKQEVATSAAGNIMKRINPTASSSGTTEPTSSRAAASRRREQHIEATMQCNFTGGALGTCTAGCL